MICVASEYSYENIYEHPKYAITFLGSVIKILGVIGGLSQSESIINI